MPSATRAHAWYVLIVVALLLLLFFARWIPHGSLPALVGDSSIFLYIGQQFNHGLKPYVDVWDLKPPMIYWLDAFSLWFTPCSPRGAVCLGCVSVIAFFIVAWATLQRRAGASATAFALLLGVNCLPDITLNPNITEVFALPFQALSFFLLCRQSEDGPRPYDPVLQGLIASVLLQLRPNNTVVIGLYLLAGGYEHIRGRSIGRLIGNATAFLAAFAAGNLAILWPLIARGTLSEYWDAVFGFGRHYSTVRPGILHLYAAAVGLLKMSRFGAAVVTGAAVSAIIAAKPSWKNPQDRFALLALALLGMEVAGSAVSGRAFEHYFLMTLLPIILLAGVFVKRCGAAISLRPFAAASFWGACAILVAGSAIDSAREIGETVMKFHDRQVNVVRYVRGRTAPSDRVLVWNGFADLLVRLDRPPATRFFHSAAMQDVQTYRDQAAEALRDAVRVPPKFILEYDSEPGSIPAIFAASPCASLPASRSPEHGGLMDTAIATTSHPWDSDELRRLKKELRERYELAYSDGSGVRVFARR